MGAGRGLLVLPLIAGCIGSGDLVRLDVDVVVQSYSGSRWVTACVREVDRRCDCYAEFPRPGECRPYNDVPECSCAPAPGDCLDAMVVLRGVTVVGRADDGDRYPGLLLAGVPDDGGGGELVLSGCGGRLQAALPPRPPEAPVLGDIALDLGAETATAEWSGAEGASRVIASYGDLSGTACNVAPVSPVQVPAFAPGGWFGVAALFAYDQAEGDLGAVRVWNQASAHALLR